MRSGGKPRRKAAGETAQTPPNLEPVAPDDQPGTQLPLGPMEEPAEILVRFSTDEPDAAEPVAAEAAAAGQVGAPPAESFAEPVAARPTDAIVGAPPAGPPAYEPDEVGPVEDASLLLRLARVHLRTGSLTTARAQLESLAGRNQLDTAGTLDLAEARWRTGDLQGAGDAAGAYLAANGGEALGLVIAAEAASQGIHDAEARGYMEQALLRTLTSFDAIFAGIPRRSKLTESERARIEPAETPVAEIPVAEIPVAEIPVAEIPVAEIPVAEIPVAEPLRATETAAEPVAAVASEPQPVAAVAAAAVVEPQPKVAAEPEPQPVAAVAAAAVAKPRPKARPKSRPETAAEGGLIVAAPEAEPEAAPTIPVAPIAGTPGPGSSLADQTAPPVVDPNRAQADTEIAAGIALLETGDALLAALHFGIALRTTPESAPAVLGAIGDRHDLALELVRGEALRMQGLEQDAGQAYRSVASALSGARAAVEPAAGTPAGPAEPVARTPAGSGAEVPAEAVAGVPAAPPGPLPEDAAAEAPAEKSAADSIETPQKAESPEAPPSESAPPISWLD